VINEFGGDARRESGEHALTLDRWTLLSERLLHDGYRKVHERRYRLPSGKEQVFEITQTPDVVCALAFDTQGNVILTRQFRPGPGRELFVPPGGILDPGETPEEAMHRELREETGYDGRLVPLHTGIQSAYTTGCRHHFLALDCIQVAPGASDPDEVVSVNIVAIDELAGLLDHKDLADVETVLAGLAWLKSSHGAVYDPSMR
jgi:ADP-ribose pyrophosphatase